MTGHAPGPVIVLCLYIVGEAIGRVIRNGDRFFFGIKRRHGQHRTEDLFTSDGHVGVDIGEHGRLHEVAGFVAIGTARSASDQPCAFRLPSRDESLDLVPLDLAHDRADVATFVAGNVDGGFLGNLLRCGDCLVVQRTLHQHPGWSIT